MLLIKTRRREEASQRKGKRNVMINESWNLQGSTDPVVKIVRIEELGEGPGVWGGNKRIPTLFSEKVLLNNPSYRTNKEREKRGKRN